jgi:hypothetical protein
MKSLIPAIILIGLLVVLLTSCSSQPQEPVIKTVTVNVPVAVPCRKDIGPEPVYADNDAALKAAPDLFTRVKLLLAGRLQRIDRDNKRQASIIGCEIIPNLAPVAMVDREP